MIQSNKINRSNTCAMGTHKVASVSEDLGVPVCRQIAEKPKKKKRKLCEASDENIQKTNVGGQVDETKRTLFKVPASKRRKKTRQNNRSSCESVSSSAEAETTEASLFQNGFKVPLTNNSFKSKRHGLPVFTVRRELLQEIRKENCLILIGETACGKTTQIPQFIYEAGFAKAGIIGITQPRRVAAITVATRVSEEMGKPLGDLVGYSVRFDDTTSANTKIKYLTDGMLLRESMGDPLLSRYSVIILDEAHERTLQTDILFGLVKSVQIVRNEQRLTPLKVIVMSATMDVDHFSHYFNNSPVHYIQGRQFSVRVMYSVEKQEDHIFSALVTTFQIHQSEPQGDILVFCTGQEEIESMVRSTRQTAFLLPQDKLRLVALPLYASLPSSQQLRAFQQTPQGHRKVIFATNIAETSVTIPGVKYVIDSGKVKARTFKPGSCLDLLKIQKISRAQAWQRTGRAGRESSGTCFRLYTQKEYDNFREHAIPEIQRCNLANVVLQLLAIGISDIMGFDFMDRPANENIQSAIDQLHLLAAVEVHEKLKLMPLGRKMSVFPLDPKFSRVILASKELQCTDEILSIIAMLSVESIVYIPSKKKELAVETRKKFESNGGDHLMLLNILRAFKAAKGSKAWCKENFVQQRHLRQAVNVRKQLVDLCARANILPSSTCGRNLAVVRKCLVSGLFMNVAELQREGGYVTLDTRQKVFIHPSSCLFRAKPSYLVFTELIQTSKCYMRNVSVVDPDWLVEAAPNYFKRKRLVGTMHSC